MARQASRVELLCHDWEALKRAIQEREVAYEFDGHEVHAWVGRPQAGDRCTCGARQWA